MVRLDVIAHITQEIGLLPLRSDLALDADQLVAVLGEYLPVPGEVGLFERGLRERGFRVEEAAELGDEGVAAGEEVVDLFLEAGFFF